MNRFQEYPAIKHPDSIEDYGRNWGDNPITGSKGRLLESEQIIESDWDISSNMEKTPTLTMADEGMGIDSNRQITSIFLEGGTDGIEYILKNTIVTYDSVSTLKRTISKSGILRCSVK